jgi:hypothetical protein
MPLADDLARADRRIAESEERIRGQYRLIARLAAEDVDTSLAKVLLKRMQASQAALRADREGLLARIIGEPPE